MAHNGVITVLACIIVLFIASASAAVVEHTFNVIYQAKHGVHQQLSGWADGPAYITQCPILPGSSYTYRFQVTGQEGTLWWHAHISMLRETLYGALIIHPRHGRTYPFPKPYKEVPILLGEWWNANIVDIEHDFLRNGGGPKLSDAFTINGQPGDLYPCSVLHTYKLNVVRGKRYLLRMINAAMNDHLFFKVAQHTFTVVAIDARYTEPYDTDVIVIAPGQSADVLFKANQSPDNYFMAAHPYSPSPPIKFSDGTTTAIVHYKGAKSSSTAVLAGLKPKARKMSVRLAKGSMSASPPLMPVLPDFKDTRTAHKFFSELTSLTHIGNPHWLPVPQNVDEEMFITIGLGLESCGENTTCKTPIFGKDYRLSSSMNNVSFQPPRKLSMLEAFHNGVQGIYIDDFPNRPPLEFNYTDPNIAHSLPLLMLGEKVSRIKRLKYNSVVEVVLQNTALFAAENHPIHFHGFDFYVLAQGFGNYEPLVDSKKFNLVNAQVRSTIAVPIGGWVVIRFRAMNPGVWLVHCHRETHLPWGLSMAFLIENGPTSSTSLPPPPPDLPHC